MSSKLESNKLIIQVASYVLYLFLFFALRPVLGSIVGIFLFIPHFTLGWFNKPKIVALLSVLMSISNLTFIYLLYTGSWQAELVPPLLGGVVMLVASVLISYSRTTSLKIKNLEGQLVALKLGLEKTEDVVFMTDSQGVIVYTNPAFTNIYGYTEEDWKGMTPRILKSGTQTAVFYKEFWERLINKKPVNVQMVNKKKDGSLIEMYVSANPIINEQGVLIGFMALERDVSKINKVEQELRKRTKELENMNQIMIDRELKMINLKKINKTLSDMLKIPQNEESI